MRRAAGLVKLIRSRLVFALFAALVSAWPAQAMAEAAQSLAQEFPKLDTTKRSIDLAEIQSGGVGRDDIPAITRAGFRPASKTRGLAATEPVIAVTGSCGAFAYPFRILIWHEIVNDRVCGRPLAITYCPLCNTALVFDRRVAGRELEFGTTGRLRKSDLVMYDRQTETFWQQFTGQALVGVLNGRRLAAVPARIESFASFKQRHPSGQVLVPPPRSGRAYGVNPYVGYDRAPAPFMFSGRLPAGIEPMARVVRVGDRAWALDFVRRKGRLVTADGLIIQWREGQNSALDKARISEGRDIGNVSVTRKGEDVPYSVDFAFAFHAFFPNSRIVNQGR